MPINTLVPPDNEPPEAADIRANFEVLDAMLNGAAESKTGLGGRPWVVNAAEDGVTEGTVGAGNGPDMNLDGGELRGALLATDDTEIIADTNAVLAHSLSIQCVNKATAVTITVLDANFPVGCSITYVQIGAGKIVFSPTAPLTLVNYSGHTKSAGQYAAVTITRLPSNRVLLTGPTSA